MNLGLEGFDVHVFQIWAWVWPISEWTYRTRAYRTPESYKNFRVSRWSCIWNVSNFVRSNKNFAPKSGLWGQKSGGLLKCSQSGVLIKSDVAQAWIRYSKFRLFGKVRKDSKFGFGWQTWVWSLTCQVRSSSKFIIFGFDPTPIICKNVCALARPCKLLCGSRASCSLMVEWPHKLLMLKLKWTLLVTLTGKIITLCFWIVVLLL